MNSRRSGVLLPKESGVPNLCSMVVEEGWLRFFCLLLSHVPGDKNQESGPKGLRGI